MKTIDALIYLCIVVIAMCSISAIAGPNDYTPPPEFPKWVEKPVQCASPQAVFERIDKDGMFPLFSSTGNRKFSIDFVKLGPNLPSIGVGIKTS